jgi:hypothetical protein
MPEIECGHGAVRFKVDTSKGKNVSAVFVRGQSANPECVYGWSLEINNWGIWKLIIGEYGN